MDFFKKVQQTRNADKAIDHIIDYLHHHDFSTDEAICILASILKPLVDFRRIGVLLLNRKERRKK